jgi:hypothetical protein
MDLIPWAQGGAGKLHHVGTLQHMVSRKGVASEAEDPTYMAVDDLELLLEQNMLVARHRGHSMPAWSTNQDMEKELVDHVMLTD